MNQIEETTAVQEEVKEQASLADRVVGILTEQGHPNPSEWKKNLPDNMTEQPKELQDELVRRALRITLQDAALNHPGLDTMNERLCVVQKTNQDDWCRLFAQGVAPCLINASQIQKTVH